MKKTILAPNAPWPAYTTPVKAWKSPRQNCINPNELVAHIKRGADTIDKLVQAAGFSREGIRTHLYKLRNEKHIEAIHVHGQATIWRAK